MCLATVFSCGYAPHEKDNPKVDGSIKLLYVCGTYAPGAFAGSELSAHQLLRELAHKYSVDVLVVTDSRYTQGHPGRIAYEGVPICGIDHEGRESAISQLIDEHRPHVVLTQLLWADVALSIAKEKNVPTVLRIISIPTHLDLSIPTAILTNAEFSSRWVLEKWGRTAHCIPSFVDLDRVMVSGSNRDARLITMFNPINVKGGHIFYEIARAMPTRKFGVVPGWHSLRAADGNWDRTVLQHSVESQGAHYDGWTPEDIDFSSLLNVEILAPREEVAEIYAQTRILVVPSQWDETFARVCIEAYANGIPVIGSAVAGLKEHLTIAGLPIRDKSNVNAWVDAIKSLDDPEVYHRYSRTGLEFVASRYSHKNICDEFIALIRSLVPLTGSSQP